MYKKVVVLLLVLSLVFTIAACSSPGGQTGSQSGSKDKYVVGYDIYFLGNSWSVQLYKEFVAEAELHKDVIESIVYTDSEGNAEKQVKNLQDMIAKKVDIILVTPCSPTAIVPVVKEAMDKGIKVVLVASAIDSQDYDVLVNVDDFQFGVVSAEWLAEQINGKGNIIALNGMAGNSTSEKSFSGAKSVFEKYPDIKIVGDVNADWDYATAKMATSNLLAANPELDAVWTQGGAMTMGAIEAFEAAQRPLVPMTGQDYNGLLKLWIDRMDQGFSCIGPSKPTWLSAESLRRGLQILAGESVEKDSILPSPLVTDDNVHDYVRPEFPDELWCMTWLNDEQIKAMFSEMMQ